MHSPNQVSGRVQSFGFFIVFRQILQFNLRQSDALGTPEMVMVGDAAFCIGSVFLVFARWDR
jgi:hypothetical protein